MYDTTHCYVPPVSHRNCGSRIPSKVFWRSSRFTHTVFLLRRTNGIRSFGNNPNFGYVAYAGKSFPSESKTCESHKIGKFLDFAGGETLAYNGHIIFLPHTKRCQSISAKVEQLT